MLVGQGSQPSYLWTNQGLLHPAAQLLAATGLRPDGFHRFRWVNITWANGADGTLLVTHGKNAAARRALYPTPRVRFILEIRWGFAGSPSEGQLCPPEEAARPRLQNCQRGSDQEGNIERHEACAPNAVCALLVQPHVPDRLGESGCDAWHESPGAVRLRFPAVSLLLGRCNRNAMSRPGGHKIGHSQNQAKSKRKRKRRKPLKGMKNSGAPGEIRTPGLLLRRQSLYPAELRAR